jgi:hypothetical protein
MRHHRVLSLVITVGLLLGVVAGAELGLASSRATPASAQAGAPQVHLVAQRVADGVRYAVAINRLGDFALRNVRVDVQLPPDAALVDAFATPGFTQFLGNDRGTLRWVAPDFPADAVVDAFPFVLRDAPQGDFQVLVRWDGAPAGEERWSGRPTPRDATVVSGEVVVGREGTFELVPSAEDPNVLVRFFNPGAVPVGDTGVAIAVPENAVPDGTVIRVRKLGPDADPPAAVGDLWWCGMVEISGVPAGVEIQVFLTARRPMPPMMPLAVFEQRDRRWEQRAGLGWTDFSGQTLMFPSRGGLSAVGAPSGVRPANVGLGTAVQASATAVPSQTLATVNRAPVLVPTVGPIPTPTPVGTIRSFNAATAGASTVGGSPDPSIPPAGEPVPLLFNRKARLLACPPGIPLGGGGCINNGGGFSQCGSQPLCGGYFEQGGLFRRDGTQSCTFSAAGGEISNVNCQFTAT